MKLRQLIELNLQTFNCTIFPMVAVSLDGKMVNVCVCIPISTPTLSGISQFFSDKKVTAPQVRRCLYAYGIEKRKIIFKREEPSWLAKNNEFEVQYVLKNPKRKREI